MRDDQAYLYDRQNGAYVLLDNDVARAVASRCDGVTSLLAICRGIDRSFQDIGLDRVIDDVTEMLVTLERESFIRLSGPDGDS